MMLIILIKMVDKFYDFYDFPSWITEDWQKFYDLAESYKKIINTFTIITINMFKFPPQVLKTSFFLYCQPIKFFG